MDKIRRTLLAIATLLSLAASGAVARKFYDDDPMRREPAPIPVEKAQNIKINDASDFVGNTLREPKAKQTARHMVPSEAVNTLDEVPDSAWYNDSKSHYTRHMTLEQLACGPGCADAPSMESRWTVFEAKLEGVTPGFRIQDDHKRKYVVKFDPKDWIEMATSADVIGSKFYYALGYNVPQNYPVEFTRDHLQLGEHVKFKRNGKEAEMTAEDLDEILAKLPKEPNGKYRGLASFYIEGQLLGPFTYAGTRPDDPNDIVPHEKRRDLRGLSIFSAWMEHTDSRAINSLDAIEKDENGISFIRHYLIDFGATFGSDSLEPKQPWQGHEYTVDFKMGARELLTFGLMPYNWETHRYKLVPGVGKYEAETFDPVNWKPSYPNPAFDSRLPGDEFWAAKQVMNFSDADIRAMVATGRYTSPEAAQYISDVMIKRRDMIGRAFLLKVLPLDRFRLEDGRLAFDDLGQKHGIAPAQKLSITWSEFDNASEKKTPLAGANSMAVPEDGAEFLAADIAGDDHGKTITVFLRNRGGRREIAGIDRRW